MNAGPATTVLPALHPTLAARLFPNSDHSSPEQPPRRVWSLPENCVPQLQGSGTTAASRPPPQGFVAVTNPLTSTSAGPADDRAVLLVDPTLSPPIRVVGYGMSAVDEAYVEGALREALTYRRQLAGEGRLELDDARHTSAFRLVHELGDGLTALAIDVYGRYADVQTYSVHWDRFLPFIRDKLWSPEFLPFLRGITVRRRFRKKRPTARFYYNPAFFNDDEQEGDVGTAAGDADDLDEEDDVEGFDDEELDGGGDDRERAQQQQLRAGDRSAEFRDVVVEEDGLKYHVDLRTSALSSGLFLDQRENRKWMLENVFTRPKMSLLNLFAHTGAWSVSAAVKAKALTTSVDHSAMCLDVAMANFRLNGIPLAFSADKRADKKGWQGGRKRGEGHEFVARDAFQELIALRAKSRKFDVVLLDPPALARTSALSGSVWSAKSDYGRLVKLAAPVVAPSGYIVAFNNTRSRSEEAWVREIMEKGLKDESGRWRRVTALGQAADFRWRAGDERVGKYLKGLVLQKV